MISKLLVQARGRSKVLCCATLGKNIGCGFIANIILYFRMVDMCGVYS